MALKLFTSCFVSLFIFIHLIFSIWVPSEVMAHRLYVFAWVEGDVVKVQGNLSRGKHPKKGMVFVYDGNGRLLLKKQVQPDGTTTFPLKNWKTGLKILLDIGNGHQSSWTLTPFDIQQQLGIKTNKEPVQQ